MYCDKPCSDGSRCGCESAHDSNLCYFHLAELIPGKELDILPTSDDIHGFFSPKPIGGKTVVQHWQGKICTQKQSIVGEILTYQRTLALMTMSIPRELPKEEQSDIHKIIGRVRRGVPDIAHATIKQVTGLFSTGDTRQASLGYQAHPNNKTDSLQPGDILYGTMLSFGTPLLEGKKCVIMKMSVCKLVFIIKECNEKSIKGIYKSVCPDESCIFELEPVYQS